MKTRLQCAYEFIRDHGFQSAHVLKHSMRCDLARAALRFGATPEIVMLGSSYVQRIAVSDVPLRQCMKQYVRNQRLCFALTIHKLSNESVACAIIFAVCLGLGMKAWGPEYENFVIDILESLELPVPPIRTLNDVESQCLARLDWRLIPIQRPLEEEDQSQSA